MSTESAAKVVNFVKECSQCRVMLPLSDFYSHSEGKYGVHSFCKTCHKEDSRVREITNPESYKVRRLEHKKKYRENVDPQILARSRKNTDYKRKYGLSLEEADIILKGQRGLCANRACGKEISISIGSKKKEGTACVDHCHDTGKVRGILCNSCNTSLGHLEQKNKVMGLTDYLHNNLATKG